MNDTDMEHRSKVRREEKGELQETQKHDTVHLLCVSQRRGNNDKKKERKKNTEYVSELLTGAVCV